MGNSNLDCAVSNMPINSGEKVMCIFLEKNTPSSPKFVFYPWSLWKLASLPFQVTMDGYSSPEADEQGVFNISNKLDKEIYNNFVSGLRSYSIKKNGTKKFANSLNSDWLTILRHGSYKGEHIGLCLEHDEIFKSEPREVNVMFIKLDVYNFLAKTSRKRPNVMTEWLEKVDNYKLQILDIKNRLNGEGGYEKPNEEERSALIFKIFDLEPNSDRFGAMNSYILNPYMRKLLDGAFSPKDDAKIRQKLHEIYLMTQSLFSAQVAIRPSHDMSPQGGFGDDVGYIKTFYKKMIKIYDKHKRDSHNR